MLLCWIIVALSSQMLENLMNCSYDPLTHDILKRQAKDHFLLESLEKIIDVTLILLVTGALACFCVCGHVCIKYCCGLSVMQTAL